MDKQIDFLDAGAAASWAAAPSPPFATGFSAAGEFFDSVAARLPAAAASAGLFGAALLLALRGWSGSFLDGDSTLWFLDGDAARPAAFVEEAAAAFWDGDVPAAAGPAGRDSGSHAIIEAKAAAGAENIAA